MTEKYVTPGSHNLHIPSKSEFHRFKQNDISDWDFCTEYPTAIAISKVASSIKWTIKNEERRKIACKYQKGGK